MNALGARLRRSGRHVLDWLKRFTIGEEHECAVGTAVAGQQEFGTLTQRPCERAPRLPYHRRIKIVEEQLDRAIIAGERREDIAATGEGNERHPIGL